MANTFYISSLGCKVNTYELEAIKDGLLKIGLIQVNIPEQADYIIVNTCCVTNTAASKSRQRISHLHQKNPQAALIVMGCYVQGFEEEVRQLAGVSMLVGTNNRQAIIEHIHEIEKEKQRSFVEDVKQFKEYENLEITSYCENTRAYLKIQDGCNNFCSYCIIPYVRGVIKSRKKEEVIKEAKMLIEKGYKEIVLTGIHTGSYGKDLSDVSFSGLVSELLDLPGLYRLRISSIEESEIDDQLIDLLIHSEKLAKHLHIPLQAGSDHILKLMNRKYTLQQYVKKVKRIQNEVPDIAITTDIIVGFPQESEEDFENTLQTAKEIGFSKIHVFPFSARKGTIAAKMEGQIPPAIKKQRVHTLVLLSDQLNKAFQESYIDKEVEILTEEVQDGLIIGHTSNYIRVKIKEDLVNVRRNDIIKAVMIKATNTDAQAILKEEEKWN